MEMESINVHLNFTMMFESSKWVLQVEGKCWKNIMEETIMNVLMTSYEIQMEAIQ